MSVHIITAVQLCAPCIVVRCSIRAQDVPKQEEEQRWCGGNAKKYKAMTIGKKISQRVDQDKTVICVTRSYTMNCANMDTILTNKDKLMDHVKSAMPMKSLCQIYE